MYKPLSVGSGFFLASGGWGKGKKETLCKGLSLVPFPQAPNPIFFPELVGAASREVFTFGGKGRLMGDYV